MENENMDTIGMDELTYDGFINKHDLSFVYELQHEIWCNEELKYRIVQYIKRIDEVEEFNARFNSGWYGATGVPGYDNSWYLNDMKETYLKCLNRKLAEINRNLERLRPAWEIYKNVDKEVKQYVDKDKENEQ